MVIDAISHYYEKLNSNIHRGVHFLSQQATDAYEASRETIRQHFNAKHLHEIIFTKGNTEAINLVANGFVRFYKREMRYWCLLWNTTPTLCLGKWPVKVALPTLKVIPMDEMGVLDMDSYKNLLSDKTKVVAVNHISNAWER